MIGGVHLTGRSISPTDWLGPRQHVYCSETSYSPTLFVVVAAVALQRNIEKITKFRGGGGGGGWCFFWRAQLTFSSVRRGKIGRRYWMGHGWKWMATRESPFLIGACPCPHRSAADWWMDEWKGNRTRIALLHDFYATQPVSSNSRSRRRNGRLGPEFHSINVQPPSENQKKNKEKPGNDSVNSSRVRVSRANIWFRFFGRPNAFDNFSKHIATVETNEWRT